MKNKKIVKFLSVLISSLIVLNSKGQIFAKKENIKQENKQENVSYEKLEEEMQKRNDEAFKNFYENENKYKIDGFELITFYKNGAPILLYKHIKTGAKIIIIPTDSLKENSNFFIPSTSFNFNIYNKNNKKYMDEYIRSAITSNFKMEELKNEKFKGFGLFSVYALNPDLEIKFGHYNENSLKKLFNSLKNPKIFKDDKIFELEKKRVLNYFKNFLKEPDRFLTQTLNINIKEIEKITKNDLLNFYKSRINPSNLLVTKHTKIKDPEVILNFLKLLDEEYFSYYDHKKPDFYKHNPKVKSLYTINSADSESNKIDGKNYNFSAYLNFSVNPFNCKSDVFITKHPFLENFEFSKEILEKIKFKEYIKKLGYLDGNFSFSNLSLYANEKSLFEEEKLKENSSKIFNYVLEKIKNIPIKEIREKNYKFYSVIGNNENFIFANPTIYNSNTYLQDIFINNFLIFNDPISKEYFEITPNNEIKDSKKTSENKIAKDFENIDNIKKEFNENPYCNINVYSKEKKEEKHMHKLLVPLKIENNKNNKTLKYLAKYFLTTNFLDVKSYENALPECSTQAVKFLEDYIGEFNTPNEKHSKDTLNFYYNDFENSIKNYKITKENFEKTKKDFIGFITNKKFVASFNSGIEIIENFLKNGYEEKREGENTNRFFKITDKTPRSLMFRHYRFLLEDCLFENFDEFIKYAKNFSEFIKRHNVKSNEEDFTITKEFAKDLLENVLNPLKKIVERTENLKKEFEENIEKISFEEFIKYIKSAKPVEKEKLEKDQNKIKELEEMSSYEIFY